MELLIVWSPLARRTYLDVLEYLEEEWTFREIERFVLRTEEALTHIKTNPSLYPYSKKSDTHKCILVKQVSLIYRVKGSVAELLVFWDNRQDPARLLL
jgi:hypothetical protein